ncbi:MAG: sodium:proton antiporter [Pirellulaceae bacterium]|nr:sodium:proton antiporter [Pirellulaceae bacterium]
MDLLLYLAIVPALGVTAQWIAWRTNLPGILLLLLFGGILDQFVQLDGFLAELTGGSDTTGATLLFPLVSLSVAVIMFEGGLSLKLAELREAGSAALRLCTIGALITCVLAAAAAHFTLDFPWRLAFLLGGILTVTGPTVIGPLLRQVRPSKRVASTLKWEGIVIDPIGAVLAVLVFDQLMLHAKEATVAAALLMLLETALIGIVLGVAGGALLSLVLRRFWLPDQLHGVAALAVGLLLFAISNHFAHESGLITVTVMGLWLTNQRNLDIEHIIEFKENLRTLLIGCLFIVLGSRVDLQDITAIGWPGLGFLVVLIVLVRPVSVFLSLLGSPLNFREQLFVAGLAPRGIVAAAVSSVFALEMERHAAELNIPGSEQLATVTFMVIVGTVAVYGLAASPLARWLDLADESTNGVLIAGADAWVRDFALTLQQSGIPVLLVDTNYNKVSNARVSGVPAVCANILNEHVIEDLPLTGIGRLLAMTPNDEINSLAVRECTHLFERSRVYQLTFNVENLHHRRGLTKNLMGRELFGKGNTFSEFKELHTAGARFKTTPLTDEFTYDDFVQQYGDGATLLCAVNGDGSISFDTVDQPLVPKSGQSVICLVASVALPDSHAAINNDADDDGGSDTVETDDPDVTTES